MLLRNGTAKGYFMVTPAALFGTERLFMLFGYSIIGISVFSFFSFQSSMVKSPEDSSEKISSGLNVNVSSALALSGLLNTCLKLFTLPFLRMIVSWNSGFSVFLQHNKELTCDEPYVTCAKAPFYLAVPIPSPLRLRGALAFRLQPDNARYL